MNMDMVDEEYVGSKVEEAYKRIQSLVLKTHLMYSPFFSSEGAAKVYLKLGALNKILSIKEKHSGILSKGFTTASSGNHGLGCVHVCKLCSCALEIYCREGVSASKLAALRSIGATVSLYGHDCVDNEIHAKQVAMESGKTYISPYNDLDVIAGNGTVGYEIYADLPEVDYVLASVGGGGFIGGLAGYLKHKTPNVKVIGCQPRNSKVMFESVKAGRIVHEPSLDTLSDGTSGDVVNESVTFTLCQRFVDNWILVDEQQIADAVYLVLDKHQKLIEGSAGVAVAAYFANKERFRDSSVVLIVCGANIDTDMVTHILTQRKAT